MFTQIKPGGPNPASRPASSLAEALKNGDESDAIDLLLGCHTRIRHFTSVALKLSQPGAPADQVRSAAAAVHKYYSQALPLHEADENDSVYPRLKAALAGAPTDPLAEANQAMVDQHRTINRTVASLLPQWQRSMDDAGAAPATAAEAAELDAAWRDHLGLEERLIFPALRERLSTEDRHAIRQEMQDRRRG
jgi:hemerythrin-like domain-containing protein